MKNMKNYEKIMKKFEKIDIFLAESPESEILGPRDLGMLRSFEKYENYEKYGFSGPLRALKSIFFRFLGPF